VGDLVDTVGDSVSRHLQQLAFIRTSRTPSHPIGGLAPRDSQYKYDW
jgi:hypothetical protein